MCRQTGFAVAIWIRRNAVARHYGPGGAADAGANNSIARLATGPYAAMRLGKLGDDFYASFQPNRQSEPPTVIPAQRPLFQSPTVITAQQPLFQIPNRHSGASRNLGAYDGFRLAPEQRIYIPTPDQETTPRQSGPGNLTLRLCYIIALTRRQTMPHPQPEPPIMPGRTNTMPAIIKALGLTLGALHFIVLAGWSGRRCGSSVRRVVSLYCQAIIVGRGRAGHQASSAPKASSSSSVAEWRLSSSCTPSRLLL